MMLKRVLSKIISLINYCSIPSNVNFTGSFSNLKKLRFDIDSSSDLNLTMGKGVRLSNLTFFIRGKGHQIKLEDNVRISEGIIWMEDYNCNLLIKNNSTFESVEFALTEPYSEICIGSECMFSRGIEVRTGDSHSIIDNRTNKRINYAKNINIGDNVWVGAHTKILKGVETESDLIIGIGSIVVGNSLLKSNSIYGGAPAKLLKSNIKWDRTRLYSR